MKHLKKFNTATEYDQFKSGSEFILPNVSFVVENAGVMFNPVEVEKWGKIVLSNWMRINYDAKNNRAIKKLKVNDVEYDLKFQHITYQITNSVDGVGYYGDDGECPLFFKIKTDIDIPVGFKLQWFADGQMYRDDTHDVIDYYGKILDDKRTIVVDFHNNDVRNYRFGQGYTCIPVILDADNNIIPCTIDLYIGKWLYIEESADEIVIEYLFDKELYNDTVSLYGVCELNISRSGSFVEFVPAYNETLIGF